MISALFSSRRFAGAGTASWALTVSFSNRMVSPAELAQIGDQNPRS